MGQQKYNIQTNEEETLGASNRKRWLKDVLLAKKNVMEIQKLNSLQLEIQLCYYNVFWNQNRRANSSEFNFFML